MYNGIGLQTARGSGTSGHIQKNLSHNVKKVQSKEDFLKQLDEMRKNNQPPPRKANPQIIEHERKREILIHKMKLRQKLQQQGVAEDQIQQRLKKGEQMLRQKFEKGLQTKNQDTHVMTQAKQKQFTKISKAFGLQEKSVPGASFDFEVQRNERLKKMEERRNKPRYQCPFEECGKTYDHKQLLDRHLKYKHPEGKREIKNE